MKKNVIIIKSFDFALRIVKLCKFLTIYNREFVLSEQLLISETSIGANKHSENKTDFIHEVSVSL